MVSYTSVGSTDIAYMWMVLLSLVNGPGFNSRKRYNKALEYIEAVFKPEHILDVHGHTEVLKPEPVVLPAAAATASTSSSEGSSSSSGEEESAASSTSAEEEVSPEQGVRKRRRREGAA